MGADDDSIRKNRVLRIRYSGTKLDDNAGKNTPHSFIESDSGSPVTSRQLPAAVEAHGSTLKSRIKGRIRWAAEKINGKSLNTAVATRRRSHSSFLAEDEMQLRKTYTEYETNLKLQALKEVISFLPLCIRYKELSAETIVVNQFQGAVVFSDASGFTALTEQLAKKPNGAEILSACLNKFFTPLIAMITSFRGDVIKFSGDALTIVFEAFDETHLHDFPCGTMDCPHTPLELACMRAVACCLEIHKRLHNFETGAGDVRLTLHIGVGAGELTLLQVGGAYERYEYVVAGPPLEQISIAEPLAGSGETVLSPSVWEVVDAYFTRGEPLGPDAPPGFARLGNVRSPWHTYPTIKHAAENAQELEREKEEAIRDSEWSSRLLERSKRFVPQCVLKSFLSGTVSNVNEMRRVSIIFVQICGVQVYTKEGIPVAAELMEAMERATFATEGSLNKFLVDDKGLLFLIVFGLSTTVHLDDPVRAIRTCFLMIESLKKMKLEGRFGVTTGRVFCGVVGSADRREYTVMGDTVNLSARLMANTDNHTTLIDEATYKRIKGTIKCEELTPIKVKGKSKLIPIFRPYPPEYDPMLDHLPDLFPEHRSLLKRSSFGLDRTWITTLAGCRCPLGWSVKTDLFGENDKSLLAKVKRWKMHKVVDRLDIDNAGYLFVQGKIGSGKVEFCELVVHKCVQAGWTFACSTSELFFDEPHRHHFELLSSLFICLEAHAKISAKEWAEAAKAEHEADCMILAWFGLIPGSIHNLSCRSVEDAVHALVARVVEKITNYVPLLITMRQISGNTLFPEKEVTNSFWRLARLLIRTFAQRNTDGDKSKTAHPLLIQVVSREVHRICHSFVRPADVKMDPLAPGATRELIWLCLNKTCRPHAVYNDEMLPKKLQDFLQLLSLSIPDYIQEIVQHLIAEKIVEVSPRGQCMILCDLKKVNIAEWVETKVVGGVQSRIESVGPMKLQVLKLATVTQGPFSALDLLGAPFPKHGSLTQLKLVLACEQMVLEDLLVSYEYPNRCLDRAPRETPRWTISNYLVRTIAKSLVLYSQALVDKRSILMRRALRVDLPGRLIKCERDRLRLTQHVLDDGPQQLDDDSLAAGSEDILSYRDTMYELSDDNEEDANEDEIDSDDSVTMRREIQSKQERVCEFTAQESITSLEIAAEDPTPVLSPHRAEHRERISARLSTGRQTRETLRASAGSNLGPINRELLEACAVGSFERAEFALELGASANAEDSYGISAIHFACAGGSLEVVRLLLLSRASIHTLTPRGNTPLVLAAQCSRLAIVVYLVDTHNALMQSGGRGSAQECGVDILEPSFWETRLPHIRNLNDIAKALYPIFVDFDPQYVLDFARKRRKVRDIFRSRLGMHRRANAHGSRLSHTREVSGYNMFHKSLTGDMREKAPITFTKRNARRRFMRSERVSQVMAAALFIALFAPDSWIILQVASDIELDIILTVITALFSLECVFLFECEPAYRWSLFFWMDILGTLSMVLDIHWVGLMHGAMEPMNSLSSDENAMVARTTRATLTARAGRTTRLVKLLRFLPGVSMDGGGTTAARGTSMQFNNLLSKSVALLTILLVIVIPLFNLGAYPDVDRSMSSWLDAFERRRTKFGSVDPAVPEHPLHEMFSAFADFYKDLDYGPYEVCIGGGIPFVCDPANAHIVAPFYTATQRQAPRRKASLMKVTNSEPDHVQASYNFETVHMRESAGAILVLVATIFLMCASTLLLSNSVSSIVVSPIERILAGIRKSAKRIFSTINALHSSTEMEQVEDNEMVLLESIVAKITKLSELVTKKTPWGDVSNMHSEDRGILALADIGQGDEDADEDGTKDLRNKLEDVRTLEARESMARLALQALNITWDKLDSTEFSVLDYPVATQKEIAAWSILHYPGQRGLGRAASSEVIVKNFVDKVISEYQWHTYHSWTHAVDVQQTTMRILTLLNKSCNTVEPIYQYALQVSAVAHDIAHPGVNNHFLVETDNPLALQYNDKSPLENMHCCKLFEIVTAPETSLFQNFTRSEYKEMRKMCIAVILHTDMGLHFQMAKDLAMLYQVNNRFITECTFNRETLEAPALSNILDKQHQSLTTCCILHFADMGNVFKPWKTCHAWAMRIMDEFFLQGDQERQLGLPVQQLNDRRKVNKPHAQLGYIEFLIIPFLVPFLQMMPMMCEYGVGCQKNIVQWHKLWLQGCTESEEEKNRMDERVKKSVNSIEVAMNTWKPAVPIIERRRRRTSSSVRIRESQMER